MPKIESKPTEITRRPLEDPHEGWILSQIHGDCVKPKIVVREDSEGAAKIASRICRTAATLANYEVRRLYRKKSDTSYAFFYCLKGELDNVSLEQLNTLRELLQGTFQEDWEMVFQPFDPALSRSLQAKLSLSHAMVYLYFEMEFQRGWIPSADFKEVK